MKTFFLTAVLFCTFTLSLSAQNTKIMYHDPLNNWKETYIESYVNYDTPEGLLSGSKWAERCEQKYLLHLQITTVQKQKVLLDQTIASNNQTLEMQEFKKNTEIENGKLVKTTRRNNNINTFTNAVGKATSIAAMFLGSKGNSISTVTSGGSYVELPQMYGN